MNILLLTYAVPFPPTSGPKVKTYHLLRHLATRHRVTLVSFTRTSEDNDQLAALRSFCVAIHTVPLANNRAHRYRSLARSLLSGQPFSVERNASAAMHALLARLVAEAEASSQPFDLVHADQLFMAPYAERLALPRLLDQHNAIYRIYETLEGQLPWPHNMLARREARLLRHYEGRVCSEFDAVTVVSDEDRQALQQVLPRPCELTFIPIAIDSAALQPIPREPNTQTVLSLAAPNWPPNADGIVWFTREVYPLVRRASPASQLCICGPEPGKAVRALSDDDPSIEVSGFIDPVPYIARAACLIVPLRQSGGMRVMILEALARGIPVVSTSVGIAGLDLRAGEHLLVADSPSDFADAVTLLLREPELGQRLASAGRKIVLERYDWRSVYSSIDSVYERMLATAAQAHEAPSGRSIALPNGIGSTR